MKTKTVTRTRVVEVPRTIDGITHYVKEEQTYEVALPRRTSRAVENRVLVAWASLLTLFSLGFSIWAISGLITPKFGGSQLIGYGGAAAFDLGWAYFAYAEWANRFDRSKRRKASFTSWALLALTMTALFWHGIEIDMLGAAVFGAFISLIAKLAWHVVFERFERRLLSKDAQWVEAQRSQLNSQCAVAEAQIEYAELLARVAALAPPPVVDQLSSGVEVEDVPSVASDNTPATVDNGTDNSHDNGDNAPETGDNVAETPRPAATLTSVPPVADTVAKPVAEGVANDNTAGQDVVERPASDNTPAVRTFGFAADPTPAVVVAATPGNTHATPGNGADNTHGNAPATDGNTVADPKKLDDNGARLDDLVEWAADNSNTVSVRKVVERYGVGNRTAMKLISDYKTRTATN